MAKPAIGLPLGTESPSGTPVRLVHTRSGKRGDETTAFFSKLGAEVWAAPVASLQPIKSRTTEDALSKYQDYHWVLVGSANAAHYLNFLMDDLGVKRSNGPEIIYVGEQTRHAGNLEKLGDGTVANIQNSKGMAEMVLAQGQPGQGVLIPQAKGGRTEAGELLSKNGFLVSQIDIYESRCVGIENQEVCFAVEQIEKNNVDVVALFAPSQLHCLFSLLSPAGIENFRSSKIVAVGETTGYAVAEVGIQQVFVSQSPSLEGMADEIIRVTSGEI